MYVGVAEVNFHFDDENHNSTQSNLNTRHIATSNSQEHGLWRLIAQAKESRLKSKGVLKGI